MDLWLASCRHPNAVPEYERGLNLSTSGMSQSEDDESNLFNKKKLTRVSTMVSDMITHHESAVSHPVSQGHHHGNMGQYENVIAENIEERPQHQSQVKNVREDPLSHRVIEKRRRDRMNNCLTDLSRLIPAEYMKKGRGRVEKTEIIEMAIKYMKFLQSNVSPSAEYQSCGTKKPEEPVEETEKAPAVETDTSVSMAAEQYKMGFFECLTETMQYLVEGHGYSPGHGLCLSLINHLQNHCTQIIKGKQVMREVMKGVKDEVMLEMNRFNQNIVMKLDVDGDGCYEDTSQQNSSSAISRNSKSQSSAVMSNNEQNLTDRSSISYMTDSCSSNGAMYKYKTDIKQRFSAENSGMDLTDYYTQDKKRRRKEYSDGSEDVPIFALHATGSYYIPLTVNREVISPMMDNAMTENRSSVIVHPISISVNFQATANPF